MKVEATRDQGSDGDREKDKARIAPRGSKAMSTVFEKGYGSFEQRLFCLSKAAPSFTTTSLPRSHLSVSFSILYLFI